MPLVICIALGSNMGNRGKDGQLATYLDIVSRRRKKMQCGDSRKQGECKTSFSWKIQPDMEYESVEVSVEENMPGFFIEMWANAPELYAVSVSSPTGEVFAKSALSGGGRQEFVFIFEQTRVSIDYRLTGRQRGNQLIYLRFQTQSRGSGRSTCIRKHCDRGLQYVASHAEFYSGNVFFLRSNRIIRSPCRVTQGRS